MADKSSHIYEIIRRLSNHFDEAISVLNTDKYVFADSRGHAEEAVEMNMRTPPRLLDDEHKEDNPPLPAAQEVDFSEYMWMGEELEEFDRQVEEELWEQELIEACFEDMLEEEEIHWFFSQLPHNPYCTALPPLVLSDALLSSRLNPEAPEFVPKAAELVAKGPAKSVM